MNRTPILVAENDRHTRDLIVAALNLWGYAPIEVDNGCDALQQLLTENPPRLAILDWMMPGLEGTEICQAMRANASGTYVYLILLTARSQNTDLVEGLESGADDFVTKPFDPDELRLRLRTGARVVALQDRMQSACDALKHRLDCDTLTGIANREAVVASLERESGRAKRLRSVFSILMFDVDHFQSLNDTHGHHVGDCVLQHVARLLQNEVRAYDTCGRYGGDEFLVLLPNATLDVAASIAQRVRESAACCPFRNGDRHVDITLSVGVASNDHEPGASVESLIQSADDALYEAKRAGRNRVNVASAPRHV